MKYIEIGIHVTDDLGIKAATINHNDTDLPSDYTLLRNVSIALLRSIAMNTDDLRLQALLEELNIKRES